ncbi:kinase-like domain-containing protein [Mycena rebaudengoi]|nr:kinase-like domain-containing protein [Mycena rebaudengoi]
MLDHGFAYDNSIRDQHIFTRHAHRFLNSLAAHLELLPQEMSITGIVLSCPHPISGGGFANVYRGQYTDADGVQVDVALKALRIFQNQTEDALAALHKKFVKEALVWYHLRHDNIVPFLGVDSTTFPGPARAMMVSPWMPLGSVLRYIASISTDYAVLNDTIQGLAYLHSAGVVHGDLHCRNILIDYDGRARLVDFGLARFVDSETSLKSSTRGGVPRWMAPELLLAQEGAFRRTPASDVWAFGCVSCEIWSGGTVPFAGFGEAFFVKAISGSRKESPYPTIPCCKNGENMPDGLWDCAQQCFQYEPPERPAADLLAQSIQEIATAAAPSNTYIFTMGKDKQTAQPEKPLPTVQFGPLDIVLSAEETFAQIVEGLFKVVKTGALSEPVSVERRQDHLWLRFPTLLEANNFAMTWTVYRFHPYVDVVALVMGDE